ncbi:MAG: fluoride efflux transporter CrcB [Phycisphaerales bacterium]|nr:fluoride efflux transporter CrcB [Phycisphaerales bacterium]
MAFNAFLVFLASGLGGLLRYALSGVVHAWWGPTFPVGTLTVNVIGCFIMGFLATALTGPILVRDEYKVAILIGLLGGFTTFSSFGGETMALVSRGQWTLAGLNVLLSNVLGLAAVWAGAALSIRLYGTGAS